MVEFVFDAKGVEPWRGPPHEAPRDYALHLWMQLNNADEDMDLHTACELAEYDREVYDALWEHVVGKLDQYPEAAAAALGRALVRKPPRKGVGAKARRNTRLRMVAARLVHHYPALPQKPHTGGVADVLSSLPGVYLDAASLYNNVLKGQ